MKKMSLVFILALMLLSCVQSEVDEKFVIDDKTIVIDVRTEKEFNQGHLQAAINIPHTEIREKIIEHVKDEEEKIIVYCRRGGRAGIAKKILQEIGYKNIINAGAYEKLKKQEKERKQDND